MKPAILLGIVLAVAFIIGIVLIVIPFLGGWTTHGTATDITPLPEITTVTPPQTVPTTVLQTPILNRADRYEETYEQIYTSNRTYKFGQKEVVSHDLIRPPLYIRFNITPGMVTREKLVDIGLSSERNITVRYINPNAWFEVTVLDNGNGTVVDKRGFNKDYSQITTQEFMIRTKGTYRIEMSGNDVSADVQILTGD